MPASLNGSKIEGIVGIKPEPEFPSLSFVVFLRESNCISYAFFPVSDGLVAMSFFYYLCVCSQDLLLEHRHVIQKSSCVNCQSGNEDNLWIQRYVVATFTCSM